jgi:antagonist of KipI
MSLRIIKAGMLDTIQDLGRCEAQHLGVNPNGAMDRFSAQLANALLGKELSAPVLELHFPAAQILFEQATVISICGADFTPVINNQPVPLDHPIAVEENSLLRFHHIKEGARAYLSILNDLALEKWQNSYSTNLIANVGGHEGKALSRYDTIAFKNTYNLKNVLKDKEVVVLPWKAIDTIDHRNAIEFIIGSEWHSLTKESQRDFQNHWFQVRNEADRMGFRLSGPPLKLKEEEQLVSSGVSFGTVQLLPGGQLIILMADHQTTGGYPRIAHIISAHLPVLAQKKPNDALQFVMTDLPTAEAKLVKQQKYLREIAIACKFRIENLFHAS